MTKKYFLSFRYGDEAGQFAENTLFAAGNIGMTAYNAKHLGIKAVAKRAAKDTGKAMIEDYVGEGKEKENEAKASTSGSASTSGTVSGTGARRGSRGASRAVQGPEVCRTDEEEWVITGDEQMDVDNDSLYKHPDKK